MAFDPTNSAERERMRTALVGIVDALAEHLTRAGPEGYRGAQGVLDKLGWPYGMPRADEPVEARVERALGLAALVKWAKAQQEKGAR